MRFIDRMTAQVRRGDPIPAPIAFALQACTPAVRLGMWHRERQARHHVNAHVVSFGNITAGGTGKTPAVIERARIEIANGRRVAVLTRGYAAPSGVRPYDSPELGVTPPYVALGDEAALILQKCPGAIVLKDADRVNAAHRAICKYGCDLLILDDGFQYLRLERDENVLMIDATNPFGNGFLIPRGILREPDDALSRATQIVVAHANRATNLEGLTTRLLAYAPAAPIRYTCHAVVGLTNLATGERHPPDWLRGRGLTAVCGIGNPDGFVASLSDFGAQVQRIISSLDHVAATTSHLPETETIVTTEKDAIRGTFAQRKNVFALEIELRDFVSVRPLADRQSARKKE
jgi:tetraacyldisaccharide 4'-kinase